MDADVAGAANDVEHGGPAEQSREPGPLDGRGDDVRVIVGVRIVDHAIGDARRRDGDRLSAEPLGEPQRLGNAVAFLFGIAMRLGGLDIDRRP